MDVFYTEFVVARFSTEETRKGFPVVNLGMAETSGKIYGFFHLFCYSGTGGAEGGLGGVFYFFFA